MHHISHALSGVDKMKCHKFTRTLQQLRETDTKSKEYYLKNMKPLEVGKPVNICSCGKKFSRTDNLKTHEKCVHQKLKVKCELCGKFLHPNGMNRHLNQSCSKTGKFTFAHLLNVDD